MDNLVSKAGRALVSIGLVTIVAVSSCRLLDPSDLDLSGSPASPGNLNTPVLDQLTASDILKIQKSFSGFTKHTSANSLRLPVGRFLALPIGDNLRGLVGSSAQVPIPGLPSPTPQPARTLGPPGATAAFLANGVHLYPGLEQSTLISLVPVATSSPAIPAAGATHSVRISGPSLDGTTSLAPWSDPTRTTSQGFLDVFTIASLSLGVQGATQLANGTYSIGVSGSGWAADEARLGGCLLIGQTLKPASLLHQQERLDLRVGSTTVATVSIDGMDFEAIQVSSLVSGSGKVSVPGKVTVKGTLVFPDKASALGIDLTGKLAKFQYSVTGTLKICSDAECRGFDVVSEKATIDLQTGLVTITYAAQAPFDGYGWELDLMYDHHSALVQGPKASLWGGLWATKSSGRIPGGKLADLAGDHENGTIVVKTKFVDGKTESWAF